MATHSSTLAWRTPWREEPGRLQIVHGVAESETTEQLHFTPLQAASLKKKNVAMKETGIRRSLQEATELVHAFRYMHVGKHRPHAIQIFG